MQQHCPSPAVVVGVDGSRSAVDAALWAVDEAVSRDIPLRLVYAIDPTCSGTDPQDAARDLAAAEIAVRHAFTAVESTDKPVKIEVEILQERPTRALRRGLTVGRPGVRRRDGFQTLRPRPDWLNRGGVGVVRPLSRGRRSWTRPAACGTTVGSRRGRRICCQRRCVTAGA